MSTRPTAPATGAASQKEDRLKAVLAAGMKRFPKLAVADTGVPPQPGGLAPAGPSLEELVRTLPNELKQQILLSQEGMSCKDIAGLCGLDREFRELCQSEDFWRAMCERFGYTIPRLLEANGLPRDGRSWRAHYELYCIYGVPPDNQTQVFEMVQGEERLVRLEYNNGFVTFFEGPRGEERMVRVTSSDGFMEFYEGPQGEEHMVRWTFLNGEDWFFEGPQGQEHMVRKTTPGGTVHFYEGPQGEERKVRRNLPDGSVDLYEGPQGEERKVREEYPYGGVKFYEGPPGQERRVRVEDPNGTVTFFEGPRDEERMVRKTFSDGTVRFYEGPQGQEQLVSE